MKKMIGFCNFDDTAGQPAPPAAPDPGDAPVPSVVKVRFPRRGMELCYLNQRFDLNVGDVVYVSGKLAEQPGIVTSVTTRFRIPANVYEQVLAQLDLHFHGTFTRVQDKMVCLQPVAIPPDRFGSWILPPRDSEDPQNQVISGQGYAIDLQQISGCEDLSPAILQRALEYCKGGNVKYLSVIDGVGRAYVQGSQWYRVDFLLSDGMMTELFCGCPCPGLCKHGAAVALTLQILFQQEVLNGHQDFVALDHRLFWDLASTADSITI